MGADRHGALTNEHASIGGELCVTRQVAFGWDRQVPSVMPGHLDSLASCPLRSGKPVVDALRRGEGLLLRREGLAEDGGGSGQLEGPVNRVEDMASHVTEGSGAEVVPSSPLEGMVDVGSKRPVGRHSEPQVPVQGLRWRFRGRGTANALGPDGAVGPGVGALDLAEQALLNEVDESPVAGPVMMLVSHLGGDAGPGCGGGYPAGLVNGAGEGLLGITADSPLQGSHGDWGVHVIRGGDGHSIKIFLFLQHDPPVCIASGLGPLFGCRDKAAPPAALALLDVTEGHDVSVPGSSVGVDPPLAPNAHRGEIRDFIGRAPGVEAAGEEGGRRSGREAAEESAAGRCAHARGFIQLTRHGKFRGVGPHSASGVSGGRGMGATRTMLSKHPGKGNSRWVDPFLGCAEAELPAPQGVAEKWWRAKPPVGNTHPGAAGPFGMVSACAYSGAYVTGYGRYGVSLTGDSPPIAFERQEALGIAHFQQSGTGRIRSYYNYLLTTPLVGEGLAGLGQRQALEEERAWPGYYSARFGESGVSCEVTCSPRCAAHRYEFPGEVRGRVAVDISSGGLLLEGMGSYPESARVEMVGDSVAQGVVRMEGIPIFFRIEVRDPVRSGIWVNGKEVEGRGIEEIPATQADTEKPPFGVWFETDIRGEPLEVRIGFSLRSVERAAEALRRIATADFGELAGEAAHRWDMVLGKIDLEDPDEDLREVFYSALYHAALKPADFTDENPFSMEDGPFFFDLATLWDQYKTQLPLLMTLWPEWGGNFVEFLGEVAQREGAFPVSYLMDNAPERFEKQATGLCHIILGDAHMRGVRADWDKMLRLLWRASLDGKVSRGRFAEFARKQVVHPLSHTLDLSCAHFALAQLAKRLGDQRVYDRSLPLLRCWENAYDENTGLLREDSDYYEGENWNYSFRLLHDMVGRIRLAGGEEAFVDLLDRFFGFRPPRPGETVHHFEGLNNEPDMEAPYLYHYAGRPDRTAEVVRGVIRYQFAKGRGGLPGNDDSGGLSSWLVWSMVGLFPVAGMPLMLIGSPVFPRVTLKLPGGEFVVEARGVSSDHIHIQKARLNGRPLERTYLKISEFHAGSVLALEMGPEPSGWGTGSRPPSCIS